MKTMRFGLDVPHTDKHGQMSVPQLEQLDTLDSREEFHSGALLRAAITEAFALLNAGARQEAIAQIKQYADLAARSNAGCYIFGLIHFNAGDLRHALTWFDRAVVGSFELPYIASPWKPDEAYPRRPRSHPSPAL
jgi:tetratricopeptide (TPR) repeat protein